MPAKIAVTPFYNPNASASAPAAGPEAPAVQPTAASAPTASAAQPQQAEPHSPRSISLAEWLQQPRQSASVRGPGSAGETGDDGEVSRPAIVQADFPGVQGRFTRPSDLVARDRQTLCGIFDVEIGPGAWSFEPAPSLDFRTIHPQAGRHMPHVLGPRTMAVKIAADRYDQFMSRLDAGYFGNRLGFSMLGDNPGTVPVFKFGLWNMMFHRAADAAD